MTTEATLPTAPSEHRDYLIPLPTGGTMWRSDIARVELEATERHAGVEPLPPNEIELDRYLHLDEQRRLRCDDAKVDEFEQAIYFAMTEAASLGGRGGKPRAAANRLELAAFMFRELSTLRPYWKAGQTKREALAAYRTAYDAGPF